MYKKILLFLIVIILLTGCTEKTEPVNYEVKINDNSVIFYKDSVIIYHNNKFLLFMLKDTELDINKYSNVINKIDYLLTNKILKNDIEAVEKYRFDKNIEINGIQIFIENKIKIVLNGNNICIYDKDISNSGNYSLCDYIYILNNEEEVYINLNDNMKVLFYNAYSNFSNRFLEHLYTTWIDTYIINKDNLTILELNDNDYIIKEISG